MDVTINTSQPTQGTNSSNASQTGASAALTEGQKADLNAERVVASTEKQDIENSLKDAEQRKFDLIKRTAASFSKGDNPFLSNVIFTIYDNQFASQQSDYEIRFTDVSTGKIEIKGEVELLGMSSAGEIVSGDV